MKTLNQKGFTLVQAVFILVVLGLLGMVMVRLIGVQTSTGVMALQGARAYHAARSGLEWGAARAVDGNCVYLPGTSLAIENFEVVVVCDDSGFQEAGSEYIAYDINARAQFGTYGDVSFVSRQLQMKIVVEQP